MSEYNILSIYKTFFYNKPCNTVQYNLRNSITLETDCLSPDTGAKGQDPRSRSNRIKLALTSDRTKALDFSIIRPIVNRVIVGAESTRHSTVVCA